jgi:hypothetical protein
VRGVDEVGSDLGRDESNVFIISGSYSRYGWCVHGRGPGFDIQADLSATLTSNIVSI